MPDKSKKKTSKTRSTRKRPATQKPTAAGKTGKTSKTARKTTTKKSSPQPKVKKTAPQKQAADSRKPAAQQEPPPQRDAETEPAPQTAPRTQFPIVGIGASAGGLEALQEFFPQVPNDTGCAFVVVTHMHREHTSMLPDLLAKTTSLPVTEATDGQPVEPDHVYVAPPGDNLTIEGGVLQLGQPDGDARLPVDHFLRSLAADQREHAVAIILSGTGTDGTLGLRAVKAEAGMAMVQKPPSAKFAGMPASAEATGLADYTLTPADMPSQLVAYVQEPHSRARVPTRATPELPQDAVHQILSTLRMRTGNDFSSYKPSTIRRRIERRINVHRIQSPHEYARYLKEHKHETNLLFRELLITVTSFFRDPPAFDALAESVTEQLRQRDEEREYRVWVPGCATGEEAYSVAIVIDKCIRKLDRPTDCQIFATDLDGQAIENARSGTYPSGIAADVPDERLKRYFTHDHDTYRINKEIRELVIFAPHNVLNDPPFTQLDLIVCRNLLIYFDNELQQQVLPTFHYALRPGGLLFLGPSETIGALDSLFEPVDRKWKVYRRKDTDSGVHPPVLQTVTQPAGELRAKERVGERAAAPPHVPRTEGQIQRLLLARFAPTCVVVEHDGNIVYIQGRTGMYLEPAEGEPQHNVLEMAREGLATPLTAVLRRAAKEQQETTRRGVRVKANGGHNDVDITVTPIQEPEALRGLYVIALHPAMEKAERPRKKGRPAADDEDARVTELEEELRHSQESLQSTVEELESSNEELKSANEELQSMNEELQSTNEELETSKEEMQSLNEELSTVNTELNAKIEDLSHANDDMQNLLNSIDVATVFLDENLHIKRYTEQARELVHLVPGDIGRPLADLALHFDHPGLIDDCRQVLKTLERREKEVKTREGQWLMMRILPYRTSENVIDGVVLTFVSIHPLKRAEQRAHEAQTYFESIVHTVREPLVVLNADLSVRSANDAFYHTFDDEADNVEGQRIYDLGDGQWDIPRLRELLENILPHDTTFNDFTVEHDFPRVGRRKFLLNARRLQLDDTAPERILLAMEDVTDQE